MALTESGFVAPIDYTARDFDAIKAALIGHVQNFFPNDWQDFTESNLGMAILELVAYVGDQLSFYLDRNANEAFLATAVQRSNVINLAALVGYVPRTTAAASTPIRATLAAQADATVIPAFTRVLDSNANNWEILENVSIPAGRTDTNGIQVSNEVLGVGDGTTIAFSFVTDNDNIVTGTVQLTFTISAIQYTVTAQSDGSLTLPFGGTGIITFDTGEIVLNFAPTFGPDNLTQMLLSYQFDQRINAYQGATRLDIFSSDGTANQSFVLNNTPVLLSPRVPIEEFSPDPNRFEVWQGDPGAPFGNGTGVQFARVDSLVTVGPNERVFSVRFDDQDRAIIDFGDNVTGVIPASGVNNIFVIYRTGGGIAGNIPINSINTSVTGTAGLLQVTINVRNPERGTGGAERESVDEIRFNAPAFLRTNETATTEQDYDALAIFSRAGVGSIARAKSRLTPSRTVVTKTIHTGEILGTIPISTPLDLFFLLPATPALVATIVISYVVNGVDRVVSANDLGSGLADLSGDPTVDQASTRLRYDEQDFAGESPGGFFGDGSTTRFIGTLVGFPVFPGSVLFRYSLNGEELVGYDDGAGLLAGNGVNATSSVNYKTGAVDVKFGEQATITSGNAETYDLDNINGGGNVILDVIIDGGATQNLTLAAGDFVDYTAATVAEIITAITGQLSGATATEDPSGFLTITSDLYGPNSSVAITGGTANDATDGLDFSTTAVTGSGTIPDNVSVISFDYQSALNLVLFNTPDVGTDVTISMESGPTVKEFPTNNIEVYTWSQDSAGNFVDPSAALRDTLKSFLDFRRVLGTSIEVLPGHVVKVNYDLTVTFDPAVDQVQTTNRIVSAIEDYFSSSVNVRAGVDVPLASVYDAISPLNGVIDIVIQDVGLRVPIGRGDAQTALFRTDEDSPGSIVSEGKLPAVPGAGLINVYVNDEQVGTSDASDPVAVLGNVSGASFMLLGGSFFNLDTGEFEVRLSPEPLGGDIVSMEFQLDEQDSAVGVALWNAVIEAYEIATVGDIVINGSKVN